MSGQDNRCPVCTMTFEETDEIVICSLCGAPHHRSCYARKGDCCFAARHGESDDWHTFVADTPKKDTTPCPVCGYPNDWSALFCFRCGESLVQENRVGRAQPGETESGHRRAPFLAMNLSSVMDPYGGLNPTEKIGNHTVEEWAAFVGPNSFYYLPRFREMGDIWTDFNYAGAFLNTFWCFFRGMKRPGILLMTIITLCNLFNALMPDYFERNGYGYGYVAMSVLLLLLLSGTVFLCGFWANRGYRQFCDRRIQAIKQTGPANLLTTLKTQGGVRPRHAYTAFAVFAVLNFVGTLLIRMQ